MVEKSRENGGMWSLDWGSREGYAACAVWGRGLRLEHECWGYIESVAG